MPCYECIESEATNEMIRIRLIARMVLTSQSIKTWEYRLSNATNEERKQKCLAILVERRQIQKDASECLAEFMKR